MKAYDSIRKPMQNKKIPFWHYWPMTLGIVALFFTGCTHKYLRPGDLDSIHRIAIVIRAAPGPTAAVVKSGPNDPRGIQAGRLLQQKLARQVSTFELEERVRGALFSRLPAQPPWTTAMTAAEVATALQSLLVTAIDNTIDYQALEASGADSVLELVISEWGVVQSERARFFIRGQGRLLLLPEKSVLWKSKLDAEWKDDSASHQLLIDNRFEDVIVETVNQLAERLVPQLTGKFNAEQVLTNKP